MDEKQWHERRQQFREAAKVMVGLVGAVEILSTPQQHAQKAAGTEI